MPQPPGQIPLADDPARRRDAARVWPDLDPLVCEHTSASREAEGVSLGAETPLLLKHSLERRRHARHTPKASRACLEWLEDDLKGRSSSTPIVLFAHIPLWTVYPDWGWGTDDSAQALSYVKHFGSVTVLNGHIHQVMQKIEGKVSFHTALSTAFPQPAPGTAPSAGPMKVPAEQLQKVLGIRDVNYVVKGKSLAIVDSTLDGSTPAASGKSAG